MLEKIISYTLYTVNICYDDYYILNLEIKILLFTKI